MNSLALLATALALADAPAERIVCVPATSGSGWECGKGEQAPAARSLPRRQEATTSAPPPYLLDPSSRPSVLVAPSAGAAPAASTPAPAAAPEAPRVPVAERAAAPAPAPVPAPLPEPATAPIAAELPATAAEPAVAPAPVLAKEPPPAATPAPDPPAAAAPTTPASAEAAPAPPPTPATEATPATDVAPAAGQVPAAAPAAVARIVSSVARDAADLLALPGDGYTIQLAATRSVQGYAALRQQLGIAVEDTFVIRVRRGSEDWWLMLWRDFPDLASARSAAATLSAHGSFWPRRLAPLQGEVRATPN